MNVPEIQIDASKLPEVVREALKPETPAERRLLLARAMVPLGPGELVAALACLLGDRSRTVANAARETLAGLPHGVLAAGIGDTADPGVLDALARAQDAREELAEMVMSNPATDDDTFVYLAAHGSGGILDRIARDQVRLERNPKLIEALYYNPETRMGTISSVLEFAVRSGIDLSHIPGYREIVESIFGKPPEEIVGKEPQEPPTEAEEPSEEPVPVEPPIEAPSPDFQAAVDTAGADGAMASALDDEAFSMMLQAAAWDEGPEVEEEEERDRQSLWTKVTRMPVPQKVRMALLGSDFVRSILVRDSRRVVYMAVLRSPKTSEKEVINFAKDKSLDEEVVRTIARNRDWTKLYAVRLALVQNPKTPPAQAMAFIRSLNPKDMRNIARSHDVPGYIAKAAKQTLRKREQRH